MKREFGRWRDKEENLFFFFPYVSSLFLVLPWELLWFFRGNYFGPLGTGPLGTGPLGTGPLGTGPWELVLWELVLWELVFWELVRMVCQRLSLKFFFCGIPQTITITGGAILHE